MVTPDPRDPLDCANGASQYLFYGGIIIIATNVVGLLAGCARQAILKVGGCHGLCRQVSLSFFTGWTYFMRGKLWSFCFGPPFRSSGYCCCGYAYLGKLGWPLMGILYFYSVYGMFPFTLVVTDLPRKFAGIYCSVSKLVTVSVDIYRPYKWTLL